MISERSDIPGRQVLPFFALYSLPIMKRTHDIKEVQYEKDFKEFINIHIYSIYDYDSSTSIRSDILCILGL